MDGESSTLEPFCFFLLEDGGDQTFSVSDELLLVDDELLVEDRFVLFTGLGSFKSKIKNKAFTYKLIAILKAIYSVSKTIHLLVNRKCKYFISVIPAQKYFQKI